MANPISTITPEIEKFIIDLYNKEKIGAQAISDRLALPIKDGGLNVKISRAPIGKKITKLKSDGVLKDVPYKDRKASIDQRGDYYGKKRNTYLDVREVTDLDKKTKNLTVPPAAKYKVDFKMPQGVTSKIPEKFQGIQYYDTKEAADAAVAERKKIQLVKPVDPNTANKTANAKKYALVKAVSDNNIERKLTNFKIGQPLETAHRLSLNQVNKTNQLYNVMSLGLDSDEVNNKAVKPFENKLQQLYTEQNKLYKKAKNLKVIPKDLQTQIDFNNRKISTVVDLTDGRIQGLQIDTKTLKPTVYGTNYANTLGFGMYDKPVKELTKIDRAEIGLIMQDQIKNEKLTSDKTAQSLFKNQALLKDVDKLAYKSAIPSLTTADKIPVPEKTKTMDMFKNAFKTVGKAKTALPAAALAAFATSAKADDPVYNSEIGAIVKPGTDEIESQSSLLDWTAANPEPLIAASAIGGAGLTTAGNTMLKGLLKTLAAPAVGAANAAYEISENLEGGDNILEAVADKSAGVGLMGSSAFSKGLGSLLGGAKLARSLTPVGAAMTAAGLGKDYYDWASGEIERLEAMDPDERVAYNERMMDDTNIDF